MDNGNRNENLEAAKQYAQQAAKTAINKAMAPVKKYILMAILTALPYILAFLGVVILVAVIYFSIAEQTDQVLEAGGDLGERLGNAVTLYGFKNESEVAEDEEKRFYRTLELYKQFYDLNQYDTVLIMNTLLYEANYGDKVGFSEDVAEDSEPSEVEGIAKKIYKFTLSFYTKFTQGFTNAYFGNSQYKKANKHLIEPILIINKCHDLTGKDYSEDFKKCYYGYLIAEFDYVIDKAVEDGEIESEVEEGYLIFDDLSNILNTLGIDFSSIFEDYEAFKDNAEESLKAIEDCEMCKVFDITLFLANPPVYLLSRTFLVGSMNMVDTFMNFANELNTAFSINFYGKIAGEQNDQKLWNNKHFFYDGYIVRFLREYYKSDKRDEFKEFDDETKQIIILERRNKKEIADTIMDTTEAYFGYSYGDEYLKQLEGPNENIINMNGSSESKKSIKVKLDDEDTELSFDDYIKLKALTEYGDQINDALENNNVEKLKLIMTIVRTDAYKSLGMDSSSDLTFTDNTNFSKDVLSLTDSQLAELSTIIQNTRGKIIKDKKNKVLKLSNKQITDMINNVSNDKNYEEDIKEVLGDDIKLSSTAQPLDVLEKSSEYGWRDLDDDGIKEDYHPALDYRATLGTPIYSISDGVVVDTNNGCANYGDLKSTCGGGFGNRVIVQYENYYVIYAHMQLNSVNVSVGNTISAGQLLGNVGSSGRSTGTHLHLEVRVGSWNQGAPNINPNDIINGVV